MNAYSVVCIVPEDASASDVGLVVVGRVDSIASCPIIGHPIGAIFLVFILHHEFAVATKAGGWG